MTAVKKSNVARPTENAAIARLEPRPLPSIPDLLWALVGCEERRDGEGRYLLGHLVVRASRAEAGR